MKRQKSTYTLRSPDDSASRQNFDSQYAMATMTEGPSNWGSDWTYADSDKISYFSSENQSFEPPMYYTYPDPWQQFNYCEDPAKAPEFIATASDLYEECSEITIPLDFSDIESVDDADPYSRNNCWKNMMENYADNNPNVPIPQSDHEYSFLPNYPCDLNPIQSYDTQSRLFLTTFRSVSIMLRHLVSVDVSPEGAIYVHNIPGQSITVVNDSGDRACIVHPNSRVLQEGQTVNIMTHQARVVKICRRGVIFRASPSSIVYLVDESGTKSTSGKFLDLCEDFTSDVFYGSFSKDFHLRCTDSVSMLSNATYQLRKNGNDVWCVGDTQIKQDQYGNIEVSRNKDNVLVTLFPTAGEVSVRTPFFKATVGCFSKRYLYVQKGDCHVSSGFCGITAQKGTQKAGLDRKGKVVIF